MSEDRSKSANFAAWIFLIAIGLAAIVLFPWSEKGSYKSPIISNAKQCALACLMYSSDNENHLPQERYWMASIQPNVKSLDILKTHNDPLPGVTQAAVEGNPRVWFPGALIMVMNCHGGGMHVVGFVDDSASYPSDETELNSVTPLIFESPGREWNAIGDPRENPSKLRKDSDGIPIKCVAFADGHAKILRKPDFEALVPDPVGNPITHKAKSP